MTAPSFTIRPAVAADRAFLESLNDRLVAEASGPGLTRENFAAFQAAYTKSALDQSSPRSATLIALDEAGTPLGYIHLESTDDMLSGTTAGYVSILAVTAEAEGKGVATRLMEEAEAWARAQGYRFLLLDVFGSNATAQRFYARKGYAADSLRLRRPID
ncbi:GNAT family N-acetyltransferase [Dongia sp.]|uniref:GNAT family N-acetyltransferase n=1 Tax=Dongia sp. TaxID=1977262 RepID=UPI00375077A6